MIEDGYIDLPPGKIAAVVTYLELAPPPALRHPGAGRDGQAPALAPIGADLARYRRLFREIGEPWLWVSRLQLADEALGAILSNAEVEALAVVREGRDIGLLELDFREGGACEIAFLGLVPGATGQGTGRFLIESAIVRAAARGVQRLWLHTCTFDHPGALAFYRKAGFRPFKRALEVLDDPRLSGLMPREAGPHVPVI